MRGRFVLATLVIGAMLGSGLSSASPTTVAANGEESIDHHRWSGADAFNAGTLEGTKVAENALSISEPIGTVTREEPELGTTRTYEYGQWTSGTYEHGFDATELIASWNARTPKNTWVQVEAKGLTAGGEQTSWFTLGQWAEGDGDIHRTSVNGQEDDYASVSVDTLVAKDGTKLRGYQLRVKLFREQGDSATPTVGEVSAMTSHVPDRFEVPISKPGKASGIELDVPAYAQNVHKGNYPEYGGGGQVWCSPTSTEMVVEYYGKGPDAEELSWIPDDYVDPSVAHAARFNYDYAYEGTGNWPFNTAYAAKYGLKGHITRLHSLTDVEEYIAKGIPVITSQSFTQEELDGAGYGTAGHIMVVIGFTENGDVIANDPAADSNDQVRSVYPREQFETIWQRTKRYDENGKEASGSGGVAYIISE